MYKLHTNIRYQLIGGNNKTAFIGDYMPIVKQHFKELLEDRNYIISQKWSPKRDKHLILNKTPATIKWDSIENECNLLNHFPFSAKLTDKVELTNLLKNTLTNYPFSINLSDKLDTYVEVPNFGTELWIIKPGKLWGGQFIQLKTKQNIQSSKKNTIQKYLERPYLFNGYKFDYRIYVLMTPDKKLYIHPFYEVRIAQKKYSLMTLNLIHHLTNLSYQEKHGYDTQNKRMTKYEFEKKCKLNIDIIKETGKIMIQTFDLIQKDIANVKSNNYFELYGVDVILDKELKPYIIEINNNPGFSLGGSDYKKHHQLINQTFNLTIDQVFDNKNIQTDFIYLKNYNK